VVTIGNPTSCILSDTRRQELIAVVSRISRKLGRKVPLFLDNAYELLVHDPATPRPRAGALFDNDEVTYELGTLSKALAPALRIGYLLGPAGPLLEAFIQRTNDVGFSAPLITQEMAAYLLDHVVDEHLVKVLAGYREKARAVRGWLETELGSDVEEVLGGQAGFYYYLTLRDIDTRPGSPFYGYCSRTTGDPSCDGRADAPNPRVIYLPGSYCVHPEGHHAARGKHQLRLSYGYAGLDELRRGVRILGEAVRYAKS
jgi:DNA-binding transcriptional MocR family regulator